MVVFYGDSTDGSSGVMTLVNRELCPRVVYMHPSGRALGIEIQWHTRPITILNIYAPNDAKGRAKLWSDLVHSDINGEMIVLGDSNIVENKADKIGSSCKILGKEVGKWEDFCTRFYLSLQYANCSSRLDRCYFSHADDWIPHTLEAWVDKGAILCVPESLVFEGEDTKGGEEAIGCCRLQYV